MNNVSCICSVFVCICHQLDEPNPTLHSLHQWQKHWGKKIKHLQCVIHILYIASNTTQIVHQESNMQLSKTIGVLCRRCSRTNGIMFSITIHFLQISHPQGKFATHCKSSGDAASGSFRTLSPDGPRKLRGPQGKAWHLT